MHLREFLVHVLFAIPRPLCRKPLFSKPNGRKQILEIEMPQHWCQSSVEKVAPWVWSMQSVIMVWYLTAGQELAEAKEMRERMGPWDSEWSLRHMIQVLQRATLNASINVNSDDSSQLQKIVKTLQNW